MQEHYHFVGIGGAGMSAIARILAAQGEAVSGSDREDSPTLHSLADRYGIHAHAAHSAANVNGATLVVASAAIKPDNVELLTAQNKGVPIVSRAQMLGRLMNRYPTRIAVSGTHGKTTTAAMIAQMLETCGFDPTALIGGDVPAWQSNARLGRSDVFVAEACEAYSSFLDLHPSISVITNVEADHLDHYTDLAAILAAFRVFLEQTSGLAVLCADDPGCRALIEGAKLRVVTYGLGSDAHLTAEILSLENGSRFAVRYRGERLGEASLAVPGRHNVVNALSAVAVGLELGAPFARIAGGLAAFHGTGRRFEVLGQTQSDVLVVDDYAHHPTELRATLAAARAAYPGRRIVAVFQPHLPSRTRDFLDEFAASFEDADKVILTDIYLAREQPIEGLSGETLAARVPGDVQYVADKSQLPDALAALTQPGDLVLTLGAGDIRRAGTAFLQQANSQEAARLA